MTGLDSAEKINAAADVITKTAGETQEWVFRQFDSGKISQEAAHEMYSAIDQLRTEANRLYTRSTVVTVKKLGASQETVLTVIADAGDAITRVDEAGQVIDLLGNLTALTLAISDAKPGAVLSSLDDIRENLEKIDA